MNTPLHLLKQTCTILVRTDTVGASGAPKSAFSSSAAPTVACFFEPESSREALANQRVTGTTTFNLWLAPTTSAGVAVSTLIDINTQFTINTTGSVKYRAIGIPRDLCSMGVVSHLMVEVDTG